MVQAVKNVFAFPTQVEIVNLTTSEKVNAVIKNYSGLPLNNKKNRLQKQTVILSNTSNVKKKHLTNYSSIFNMNCEIWFCVFFI